MMQRFNPIAALRKALTVIHPGAQARGWVALLPRTSVDYKKEVRDGVNSSIVTTAMRWAQKVFQEAPMTLSVVNKEGNEEIMVGHKMMSLLDSPNTFYDGLLLQSATVGDLMVSGNAYWIKVRTDRGALVQLWWIPSTMIEPRWPTDGSIYISHYEYSPGGGSPLRYPVEDVVHFRDGIDSSNIRKGASPLQSLFREIFTDEEAANMTAALIRNSGVPGVVISPDVTGMSATPEAAQATKERFMQSFSGDHRGEPLVMTGPTRVSQFGFSPEQMNVRSLRRIPEERVSSVLGIPAIVLGLGAGLDRSTFSNYSEAREAAYEQFVIPMQRIFAGVIKRQLLSEWVGEREIGSWRVGFDLSKIRVLQEDQTKLITRLDARVRGGWMTIAAAKQALGETSLPEDEIYLRPLGLLEVPTEERRAQMPEPEPVEEPEGEPAKGEERASPGKSMKMISSPKAKAIPQISRSQVRILRAMDRDASRLREAFSPRLSSMFLDLGRRSEHAYASMMGIKVDPTSMTPEDLILRVLAAIGLLEFINDKVIPLFKAQYKLTGEMTFSTLSEALRVTPIDKDALIDRMVILGGQRGSKLNIKGDTEKAISQSIIDGLSEGGSVALIPQAIQEAVSSGSFRDLAVRSAVVASTEVMFAQVFSSIEILSDNPSSGGMMLLDARLGPTDDTCEFRNGRVVTPDEARAALEDEHPNGTLMITPVI